MKSAVPRSASVIFGTCIAPRRARVGLPFPSFRREVAVSFPPFRHEIVAAFLLSGTPYSRFGLTCERPSMSERAIVTVRLSILMIACNTLSDIERSRALRSVSAPLPASWPGGSAQGAGLIFVFLVRSAAPACGPRALSPRRGSSHASLVKLILEREALAAGCEVSRVCPEA